MRLVMASVMALLLAAPAAAQYRMRVTPPKPAVPLGTKQVLDIEITQGRAWQASPGDKWHTMVQPKSLARVELIDGKLHVHGLAKGTGKLHIWHKTRLSWQGLYVVLPLEVTDPPPRERPGRDRPGPGRHRGGLEVYRIDGSGPARMPEEGEGVTSVLAGESVRLGAYFRERGRRSPARATVSDASNQCRLENADGHRFTLTFPPTLADGTRVTVRIGAAGTSDGRGFVFEVKRPRRIGLDLWFRGPRGDWEVTGEGTLRIEPGAMLFLRIAGRGHGEDDLAIESKLVLEGGLGASLIRTGKREWMFIAGFAGQQPVTARLTASSPLTRDGAVLNLEIARR